MRRWYPTSWPAPKRRLPAAALAGVGLACGEAHFAQDIFPTASIAIDAIPHQCFNANYYHSCIFKIMADGRPPDTPVLAHAEYEPPSAPPARSGADAPIRSNALFEGRSTLTIEHEGTHYVLRATRSGKLILTK